MVIVGLLDHVRYVNRHAHYLQSLRDSVKVPMAIGRLDEPAIIAICAYRVLAEDVRRMVR